MARSVAIQELWAQTDALDIEAFVQRTAEEDLIGALHAVEGASQQTEDADRDLLETWAFRVRERLIPPTRFSPVHGASVLREVLGVEAGLRGDAEDYHNPKNSMLHHVLTRRRGLPILLSSIWIHVGATAGLPVFGIGLPGHFLVRIGTGSGAFSDPFFGGIPVTLEDCKRRVKDFSGGHIEWQNSFLTPCSVDGILERVLKNLLSSHQQAMSLKAVFRTAEFLCALKPESMEYRLTKAQAALNAGAWEIARRTYGSLVEQFPDAEESILAEDALEKIQESPSIN